MSVAAVIAQSWWASQNNSGDERAARPRAAHSPGGDVPRTTATPADVTRVAQIRSGESGAFDALVLETFPLLSRVAGRLAGSAGDGEEIAQDVLCSVWIKRESLPDTVPLTVYLLTAVRRRALNLVRDRQTIARHRDTVTATPARPEADAQLIAGERNARIRDALDGLSPRHRLAIEMRYGAVASFAEIGAALNVSARAAEQIVRRALGALRQRLGDIDL